jgi:hypothetical protein
MNAGSSTASPSEAPAENPGCNPWVVGLVSLVLFVPGVAAFWEQIDVAAGNITQCRAVFCWSTKTTFKAKFVHTTKGSSQKHDGSLLFYCEKHEPSSFSELFGGFMMLASLMASVVSLFGLGYAVMGIFRKAKATPPSSK